MGLSCTIVNNGREAVKEVSESSFDVVLMDIEMPELNGFDAAEEIRQLDSAGKNTPIIALTGHSGEEELNHCFEVGMNDYVLKPIKRDVLEAAILKIKSKASDTNSANRPLH